MQRPEHKVVCVGLNRTGTTTCGEVLRELGYTHVGVNPNAFKEWASGGCPDTSTFESFDDLPWSQMYAHFYSAYEKTKFILTTRVNEKVWLRSLYALTYSRGKTLAPYHTVLGGNEKPWDNPEACIQAYRQHNKKVRAFFQDKPEWLLEVCWESGDGWKQVCEFLGKPIPDKPFPNVNALYVKLAEEVDAHKV